MDKQTERRVQAILDEAERALKPCTFEDYERLKVRLMRCELTIGEYAAALRQLCDALEI